MFLPWNVIIIAVVVALSILLLLRRRTTQPSVEATVAASKLQERLLTVQGFYLDTLRREIANIVLSENLEAFEKAFNCMCEWEAELALANRERLSEEYRALLSRYPDQSAFDILGTRHFIPYAEHLSGVDELLERYKDISKFLIVDNLLAKEGGAFRHFGENEAEVFQRMRDKLKGKNLQAALSEAMRRYWLLRSASEKAPPTSPYSYVDEDFDVWLAPHSLHLSPDNAYGIHCKKLNEYGAFATFYDERRGKDISAYFRTDSKLRNEVPV